MRVTYLARLLDVSADTIRRWIDVYRPFLTLKASSVKGSRSLITEHDTRVLTAISQLHNSGLEHSAISECLKHMQEKGWRDLPTLPREKDGAGSALSVGAASGSESGQIQVAVLQKEVEYAREALHRIQSRIEQLETQIQAVNDEKDEVIRQKRALELELVQTKNALSLLKTELNAHGRAYSLRMDWEMFQVKLVLGTAVVAAILTFGAILLGILAS